MPALCFRIWSLSRYTVCSVFEVSLIVTYINKVITNVNTVLKSFKVFVPQKECATMLTQVWQCDQSLSTAHKARNLGRHSLDVYWFHWHKLLHSQLSKQYSQSGKRGINSTERAWSNRCIFQTSAICSSTGMLQEGEQAVVLVGSLPTRVVKLIRMRKWKEANRLSILTH